MQESRCTSLNEIIRTNEDINKLEIEGRPRVFRGKLTFGVIQDAYLSVCDRFDQKSVPQK